MYALRAPCLPRLLPMRQSLPPPAGSVHAYEAPDAPRDTRYATPLLLRSVCVAPSRDIA